MDEELDDERRRSSKRIFGEEWEPVFSSLMLPYEHGGRGWELVSGGRVAAVASSYEDDISIFPPSDHEGLHIQKTPIASSSSPAHEHAGVDGEREMSSSSAGAAGACGRSLNSLPRYGVGALLRYWILGQWSTLVEMVRKEVGLGFERVYSKVLLFSRGCGGIGGGKVRGGSWSIAAFAGLVVALLFMRYRHRREKLRLFLIIQEKDKKISQLSHQLAQMREILSARRNVSILKPSMVSQTGFR